MQKKKILIADDEAIFRKALEQVLLRDFDVITAIDGDECLKLLKKNKPDLIILDILMPGKNGMEVLKILKEDKKTKNIPVLLLTNIEKTEAVSEGISLGARGYLLKTSYNSEEILEKVKSLL